MMLYPLSNARWFRHKRWGWYRNGEWLTWWLDEWEAESGRTRVARWP